MPVFKGQLSRVQERGVADDHVTLGPRWATTVCVNPMVSPRTR